MKMRGHTLVWQQQMAPWFKSEVTKENAGRIFDEHIRTVAGHYRGKMHSWDVVNEAIQVKDGLEHGLRQTPWLEMLGPEYVERAFRVAHEADPKAMLCYNDFGLDYDDPADEAKRGAVLALLRRLKERKAPIHGFGTQAHLNAGKLEKIKAGTVRKFFAEVAALGLKILITELDVIDADLPDDIAQRDKGVAETYEAYLSAALEEKAVVAVVTWGLTDRYTWLARRHKRPSGEAVRVLPLDREYGRKPAWHAVARAIDGRRG
jgi:endo-1,4-beta-xylanase